MLKLPRCPYCGCTYSYGSINKIKDKKQFACNSCKKIMNVFYKKSAAKMAVIFFIGLIIINTFVITFTKSETVYPNIVMTVLFIFLYLCLVPFTVKFGKIDGQEEKVKLKKNRHRYNKVKNSGVQSEENPLKDTVFDK